MKYKDVARTTITEGEKVEMVANQRRCYPRTVKNLPPGGHFFNPGESHRRGRQVTDVRWCQECGQVRVKQRGSGLSESGT